MLRSWKKDFKKLFEESIYKFKSHLRVRGYPDNLVINVLVEVKFTVRESALQQKLQKLTPFVTQYNPSVPSLKKVLINGQVAFNWKSAIAEYNTQRTTSHLLKKREVSEGHSC